MSEDSKPREILIFLIKFFAAGILCVGMLWLASLALQQYQKHALEMHRQRIEIDAKYKKEPAKQDQEPLDPLP